MKFQMKHKSSISFGLPADYREQKSRHQAEFLERAKQDPAVARSAMAFLGVQQKCKVEIVREPYFESDEERYAY